MIYKTKIQTITGLLACFVLVLTITTETLAQKNPKNVIVLIGDGMGMNHILATNYYIAGKDNAQVYEKFPTRYFMSTYMANLNLKDVDFNNVVNYNTGYNSASAWSTFTYLKSNYTDSAPAATSMATGKKTYGAAIGMGVDHQPLENLCERAIKLGKAAGVVSSVPISHATPAGFAAHNVMRDNYEEIALNMLLDSKLKVIMGCGNPLYTNNATQGFNMMDTSGVLNKNEYRYVGGKQAWESLHRKTKTFDVASISGNNTVQDIDGDGKPDPWTLIQDSADFVKYATSEKVPERLIGVPKVYTTLQQGRSGGKEDAFTVPFNLGVPSLAIMAQAALNVLDNDEDGLFLMIEGGAIDWAAHANQPGRVIEETNDFNKTVEAVIEWVETKSSWDETLVIVTADHETGYITGIKEKENSPITNPVINNGKNTMPGMLFNSGSHTNQLVPFFAKGAGSEIYTYYADEYDYMRGYYINNTELAQGVFLLWGLNGK